ncbi:hypothetical protein B0H13DRAFT_1913844 [Mycena leptocephala]|nr:hypothetical protein B0H13DRAFT_1913844 [Mycena leptocephala]
MQFKSSSLVLLTVASGTSIHASPTVTKTITSPISARSDASCSVHQENPKCYDRHKGDYVCLWWSMRVYDRHKENYLSFSSIGDPQARFLVISTTFMVYVAYRCYFTHNTPEECI